MSSTDTVATDILTTKTGSNNKIYVQKGLDLGSHKLLSTSAEVGTVFADNLYGLTYPVDPDASRTILVQDDITTNKRLRVF